jgi:hypothetical protein
MFATARARIRAVNGHELRRQNASSTADRPFRKPHVARGTRPSRRAAKGAESACGREVGVLDPRGAH